MQPALTLICATLVHQNVPIRECNLLAIVAKAGFVRTKKVDKNYREFPDPCSGTGVFEPLCL
jgi:hypothetical protein